MFAPVVEMYEFFDCEYRKYGKLIGSKFFVCFVLVIGPKYSRIKIEEVYVLQHFEDMFESGNFEDRMAISDCLQEIKTNFFFYDNVTSDNIKCLSFHGYTSQLINVIDNTTARFYFNRFKFPAI